jgi:protein N-terminal amidase
MEENESKIFPKKGGKMSLKAGVVQFSPMYGRVTDNLDRLERLVEEGVRCGAQLLVLPEMAWTGYLWPHPGAVQPYAETAGSGTAQERIGEWSRRWNIRLVYGFPEIAGTRYFNSQGLASPDGALHLVYRKTHLFEADQWWADPGDTGYLQWPSPWGPIGSGICMDLNFPDLPDYHRKAGTAILAFSTNWLDQDFDVVPYWREQLAGSDGVGFQGLALFSNRGGEENGVAFRGQSSIFFRGRCLSRLPGKDDGILVAEVPLP